MKVFTARCIQYASLALAFILCYSGAFIPNFVIIGIGATIGLFGAIIWIIFGRCSQCRGHLGRYVPEYCPHCGKKIE